MLNFERNEPQDRFIPRPFVIRHFRLWRIRYSTFVVSGYAAACMRTEITLDRPSSSMVIP